MKNQLLTIVALLILLLPGYSAFAQTDVGESTRPKIGLVLGGGGARGAAHIGVLRELERQRIPIDAIAGTSMGAIVGGLYAAGMSVAELEELVGSLDWSGAFKDVANRENLRYRRKQDDAAFPMNLELGIRNGEILIPKGVLQGQRLGLILRQLTLDVSQVQDFNRLPIPFRAVASDIATGESVVMDSGDLAIAIRASMSAPGIFAPVRIGDHTLVDGGLVGNVPVEAMRELDIDIIIAVDVEFPLFKPDELTSALAISAQMLTILIRKETMRQLDMLGPQDFLIRPELGEFGSANFAGINEAIEPGTIAARQMEDKLSVLSVSDSAFESHVAERKVIIPATRLEFVRVRDDGALSERVIRSRLKTEAGDPIDAERLAADAARLYGLQLYDQVDFRIVTERESTGVEFETRPKDWGPNFLKFGVSLQDDLDGNTSFNVSSRMTRAGINSLGAEWRTDLRLGTEPLLVTEFYQPLSFNSRYFVAPRLDMEQTNFNVFTAGDNVARYRVSDALIALDVGRELGLWGEVRLGVFRGIGEARLNIGDPVFPNVEFQTGGVFASFNVDTLDNAQIPLHGSQVNIEWTLGRPGLGSDDNYESISAFASKVWTTGRHSLNAGVNFNTSRDADDIVQNFFTLGGFLNLSGFAPGQISGPHSALARLSYYRRSGQIKGAFAVPLYIGASLEAGNVWQSRSDISMDSLLIHGSVYLGLDTFVGPVIFAAGFGEGGNKSLYLSIGSPIN